MKTKERMEPSMEEKIGLRMLAVGIAAMLVTAVLTMTLFHRVLGKQVQQDLRATAQTVARAYEHVDAEELGGIFADQETRITRISNRGDVLYESMEDAPSENHLTRPEVQQALEKGEGYARRKSATSGYDTYYYALRMDDGTVLRAAVNARSFFSLYDEALPAGILCLVVVLAISTGAAVLLTRRIVGPIEQMGKNLGEKITPPYRELAAGILCLVVVLAISTGAAVLLTRRIVGPIEQMGKNLGEKITPPYRELAPFAAALEAERGSRDEVERMRREFTANVSHELKTPLTSISGYAELIETGLARPGDVPDFAGRIKRESARLLALIGDILELSRLESPADGVTAKEFRPEKLDLGKAASAAAQRLQFHAQKAYVTLLCDVEPEVQIKADPRLIDELLQNLADNAIRYNRPGGRVVLRVQHTAQGPLLTVEDTGLGIPKEHQAHVFERFYRVDKSRSKATGGTGLGLAIVKHIALLHQAQLSLQSEEGEGTRITVQFQPLPRE